jgi:hypothetical protein
MTVALHLYTAQSLPVSVTESVIVLSSDRLLILHPKSYLFQTNGVIAEFL